MRKALWLIPALAFAFPAFAHDAVYSAHDKWPWHSRGDCDHKECKDPAGVPEPAPLFLLSMGVAGVLWVTRRKSK